eukprot:CAMPEP_0184671376 /NCGR_PEP_ID=MMETSP0308-20130426/85454_1 /TAXON_ID=38269 /ORGANISM="Gloeochaete witrockiana, Strain SAG 46.84" /LENGTH=441 /DNA_ID=CAMNT_0027118481 /DNA_START=2498 /DNA_END=3820 /DNA_ORIENTATION=+
MPVPVPVRMPSKASGDKTSQADGLGLKLGSGPARVQGLLRVFNDMSDEDLAKVLGPVSGSLEAFSVDVYATFWGLALYDLLVPRDEYKEAAKRLEIALSAAPEYDKNGKKCNDKDLIQKELQDLKDEITTHEKNFAEVANWLLNPATTFKPPKNTGGKAEVAAIFVEQCLIPRIFLSFHDAAYAARFIFTIQMSPTCPLDLILILDRMFINAGPCISSCTEKELLRLARFFSEVFAASYRLWDVKVFTKEAVSVGKPGAGSGRILTVAARQSAFKSSVEKYSDLLLTALMRCLSSNEQLEIRNALTFLKHVFAYFPAYAPKPNQIQMDQNTMAKMRRRSASLENLLLDMKTKETREDLKLLCTSIHAMLAPKQAKGKANPAIPASAPSANIPNPNPASSATNARKPSAVPPPSSGARPPTAPQQPQPHAQPQHQLNRAGVG